MTERKFIGPGSRPQLTHFPSPTEQRMINEIRELADEIARRDGELDKIRVRWHKLIATAMNIGVSPKRIQDAAGTTRSFLYYVKRQYPVPKEDWRKT